jgi:hypothetical protein
MQNSFMCSSCKSTVYTNAISDNTKLFFDPNVIIVAHEMKYCSYCFRHCCNIFQLSKNQNEIRNDIMKRQVEYEKQQRNLASISILGVSSACTDTQNIYQIKNKTGENFVKTPRIINDHLSKLKK